MSGTPPAPAPRTLGILLATPEGEASTETVLALARACVARGDEVLLYLVDEGVRNLLREDVSALGSEPGVRLYCCAYGAQRRGIPRAGRAVFCGLYLLHTVLRASDRFLAFT